MLVTSEHMPQRGSAAGGDRSRQEALLHAALPRERVLEPLVRNRPSSQAWTSASRVATWTSTLPLQIKSPSQPAAIAWTAASEWGRSSRSPHLETRR